VAIHRAKADRRRMRRRNILSRSGLGSQVAVAIKQPPPPPPDVLTVLT
jgi:hypothetical protein